MNRIGELRIGRGILAPALADAGRCLLVVAEPLLDEALASFAVPPTQVVIAATLEQSELDTIFEQAPAVDRVTGVGGGVALDVAKYGAGRLGVPFVAVPTILSTTAWVNPLAVLRDGTRSLMVPAPSPETIVVDLAVLGRAPRELNIAGLGDVLSCHTALHDWRLAVDDGRDAHPWDERAARQAQLLVESVAAHAGDLRVMNDRALKLLVDMHIEVVDICQELGHARAEAGSEHLLVEAIEETTGRSFLHGPIVGLGIDVMSELQGNAHDRIVSVMDEVGLPHSPRENGLARSELVDALTLLAHSDEPPRWHSVVDYAELGAGRIEELVGSLAFT